MPVNVMHSMRKGNSVVDGLGFQNDVIIKQKKCQSGKVKRNTLFLFGNMPLNNNKKKSKH